MSSGDERRVNPGEYKKVKSRSREEGFFFLKKKGETVTQNCGEKWAEERSDELG